MTRNMLLGNWAIYKELDATNEELVTYLKKYNMANVRVIEGDFVRFKITTEIDKEAKEEIFRKHAKGSVIDEPEEKH